MELNPVPDRITPLPFSSGGEEYLRLLREAQRDSLPSSARHSLASSRRGTPRDRYLLYLIYYRTNVNVTPKFNLLFSDPITIIFIAQYYAKLK